MSSTLQKASRSGRGFPYDAVRVLLIYWEEPFAAELKAFQNALSTNFSTWTWETFRITGRSKDMTDTVRTRILQFAAPSSKLNELLIVMYGGHAISPSSMNLEWRNNDTPQFVDWNTIQDANLFPVDKDILVLLDCCFAGAATRSATNAQKEILAASRGKTPVRFDSDRKRQSFTWFLQCAALSFTRPFTVDELRRELVRRGFSETPVYERRPEPPHHDIILAPSTVNPNPHPPQAPQPSGTNRWWSWPDRIDVSITISGIKIRIRLHFGSKTRGDRQDQQLECTSPGKISRYRCEKRAFFSPGKVFVIPWSDKTDPAGFTLPGWPCPETGEQERMFVVVREGESSCSVVEILGSQTPVTERHGTVFSGKSAPRWAEKRAVRIQCDDRSFQLDPHSHIDYGTAITVQYSVPVRSIGRVQQEYLQVWMQNLVSNGQAAILESSVHAGSSASGTPSVREGFNFDPRLQGGPVQAGPSATRSVAPAIASTGGSRLASQPSATLQAQARAAVERLMSQGMSQDEAIRTVRQHMQPQQHQQHAHHADADDDEDDEDDSEDDGNDDEDDEEESSEEEDVRQKMQRLHVQQSQR